MFKNRKLTQHYLTLTPNLTITLAKAVNQPQISTIMYRQSFKTFLQQYARLLPRFDSQKVNKQRFRHCVIKLKITE